jgi:Ca2+-binding RTX toxin-like protein
LEGNAKANKIMGGKGNDFLKGNNGEDYYVIGKGEGDDTIDNMADDEAVDYLFFEAKINDLKIDIINRHDLKISSRGRDSISATLKNWFKSEDYRYDVAITLSTINYQLSTVEYL